MRRRRIYKVHHNFRGWRTSLSRANSSQVYHTSYPVLVHRPALSDWPSFRPRLTTTPLAFSLPSAPRINTWSGDLHPGSHMPCLAHTLGIRGGGTPSLFIPLFGLGRPSHLSSLSNLYNGISDNKTAMLHLFMIQFNISFSPEMKPRRGR